MPKYRATATSFVNNRLIEPGDVVDLDGDVSPANFEPADKEATAAAAKAEKVPAAVEQLISAVKLHAASRGATPAEVNETDFEAVVAVLTPTPSTETIKQSAAKLGVTLGQSVA